MRASALAHKILVGEKHFLRFKRDFADRQHTVAQNFRAQSAVAAQPVLGAGRDDSVHPVAGPRFARAFKFDSAKREAPADQSGKIESFDENIATKHIGRELRQVEFTFRFFVNLPGKKSDLTFVVGSVSVETVALESPTRTAVHRRDVPRRMLIRFLPEAAKEIVSRRNKEVADDDGGIHAGPTSPRCMPAGKSSHSR